MDGGFFQRVEMAVLPGLLAIGHCPAVVHPLRPGILLLTAHICRCVLVAVSVARGDLRLLVGGQGILRLPGFAP